MQKILIIIFLFSFFLSANFKIILAANPTCSSKGIQVYTTDSKGNSVGPAKDIPFNIEVRYSRIQTGSLYKLELKAANSGRTIDTYLIQASEVGKISIPDLQMPGNNPGPYLFTLSETKGGANTAICDSSSFRLLTAPLSEEELKKLQEQQKAGATTGGCKPGDTNCTSAKGVPCTESKNGIMTAIGCVPTEPLALVEGLLRYGTLAAGGIAFLLMILGALQMITAEGNPEAIKNGQERFYSAIIGLLLIIFSVLLMQVIGVDILGLPDLGGNAPAFNTSKGDSS